MNRPLTHEESVALYNLIEMFLKATPPHHPIKMLVANYSGSYPNNPEKAMVFFEERDFKKLANALCNTPSDKDGNPLPGVLDYSYYGLIQRFILSQPDDKEDYLSMKEALEEALEHVNQKICSLE